jgi:hypothetical protein
LQALIEVEHLSDQLVLAMRQLQPLSQSQGIAGTRQQSRQQRNLQALSPVQPALQMAVSLQL